MESALGIPGCLASLVNHDYTCGFIHVAAAALGSFPAQDSHPLGSMPRRIHSVDAVVHDFIHSADGVVNFSIYY